MYPVNLQKSDTLKQRIESLMLQLCIPANLKGFRYLSCALYHAVSEPLYQTGVYQRLRSIIAQECGTTAVNVERDIRTALHKISGSECAALLARPEYYADRNITFKEFVILCVSRLSIESSDII